MNAVAVKGAGAVDRFFDLGIENHRRPGIDAAEREYLSGAVMQPDVNPPMLAIGDADAVGRIRAFDNRDVWFWHLPLPPRGRR